MPSRHSSVQEQGILNQILSSFESESQPSKQATSVYNEPIVYEKFPSRRSSNQQPLDEQSSQLTGRPESIHLSERSHGFLDLKPSAFSHLIEDTISPTAASTSGQSAYPSYSTSSNAYAPNNAEFSSSYGVARQSSKSPGTAQNSFAPTFLSQTEEAILRSANPIQIDESEEITVLGQRGIWVNKDEVQNWRGPMPISQYCLNEDPCPEIITKRSDQNIEYVQGNIKACCY